MIARRRTEEQRTQWRSLTPYTRRLLVSHRRDDLEREEAARRDTLHDLEEVWGPLQWDATVAVLAEGEPDGDERAPHGVEPEMTLEEIGVALGLSRGRIYQIEQQALRKLEQNAIVHELVFGEDRTKSRHLVRIGAAIRRAIASANDRAAAVAA